MKVFCERLGGFVDEDDPILSSARATYRVHFGHSSYGEFRTFAEALDCARKNQPASIVNPSEVDGAPDSSARAQAGLTKAEWARLEAEGLV